MSNTNVMKQQYDKGKLTQRDARLGFACRGCGQLCCVDTEVLVSPPEALRVEWLLKRRTDIAAPLRLGNIKWGKLFLGGSTGLPLLEINFVPLDPNKLEEGTACPFLAPVFVGDQWVRMAWCAIREARPAACRVFPVGRARLDITKPEWEYRIMSRCPGFTQAVPGEPVPPGYAPNPTQTVQDWLNEQCLPEQDQEKNFYLAQVVPAYLNAGLHASTPDKVGMLPDEIAIGLLGRLFYGELPPLPSRPEYDHEAIMAWLKILIELVPAIRQRIFSAQSSFAPAALFAQGGVR